MVASIGLFIYLLIVAFYVSEMEPPDMLGRGGGGGWRGGGGEVEGRWRGGGGEVEGRWKDGLFQDLHVMFATGAIRN